MSTQLSKNAAYSRPWTIMVNEQLRKLQLAGNYSNYFTKWNKWTAETHFMAATLQSPSHPHRNTFQGSHSPVPITSPQKHISGQPLSSPHHIPTETHFRAATLQSPSHPHRNTFRGGHSPVRVKSPTFPGSSNDVYGPYNITDTNTTMSFLTAMFTFICTCLDMHHRYDSYIPERTIIHVLIVWFIQSGVKSLFRITLNQYTTCKTTWSLNSPISHHFSRFTGGQSPCTYALQSTQFSVLLLSRQVILVTPETSSVKILHRSDGNNIL